MHRHAKAVPAILFLIVFSFFLACVKGSNGHVDLSVSEAKNMIDSDPLLAILDVRTQSEYDSGHIRNAKLIPHTELEARIGELDENRETLVYCRSGGRSATSSQILVDHGFTQVYNMLGGTLAWIGAGFPVYVRYASIQQSINTASDGDKVFVSSGTYPEHLVVNKSLTLIGEDRNTTIIDGGGAGNVVLMTENNTFISDFTIRASGCGCANFSTIRLKESHNSNITGNRITYSAYGVWLQDSNGCTIGGNIITDNGWGGIELVSSNRNNVASNDIRENNWGIRLRNSSNNMLYHNNIVDNKQQASVIDESSNTWDYGYSSGGNYWSDYIGIDLLRGPYQNETGSDGIGDTPYILDANNQDNFPLMNPYIPPEELRVLYYELLEEYNDLLADYQSLNSTYYELLHSYSDLLVDLDALNATYCVLLADHDYLNSTYYTLLSNNSELQGNYDSLQTSYDDLQEDYDSLNSTYNELKSKQEATTNELNTIRPMTYILTATTIILIATTVYLVRRKPR